MNKKGIGFLLIALLVVLLAIFWEKYHVKSQTEEKMQSKLVFGVQKLKVSEVEWFEAGEQSFRLINKQNQWFLDVPVQAPADQNVVNTLVSSLIDYKFTKKISVTPEKLPDFGIKDSSTKIKITFLSGESKTIVIGDQLSTGYHTYSSFEGENVIYVGSQYLSVMTNKSFMDVRKKTFIEIDHNRLMSINLKNYIVPNESLKVEFKGGESRIVEPSAWNADQIAVNRFIDSLNRIRAVGFYDPETHPREIQSLREESAIYEVAWESQGGLKSSIMFYDWDGSFWAAYELDDQAYRIPSEQRRLLDRSVLSFRDRTIFHFSIDDVTTIRIDDDIYKKESSNWIANKSINEPLTHDQLRGLLIDMESIKTARYIEVQAYSELRKNNPYKTIEIMGKDLNVLAKFWHTEQGFLVSIKSADHLYEIPKAFFSFIDEGLVESDGHSHD